MILCKVPGVNGLGKTQETGEAPDVILEGFDLRENRVEKIVVDRGNLEEQEKAIYEGAGRLFATGEQVVFVGGDHSISYPIVRAFSESWREDVRIVIFDAHADCMKPMSEPTHEEWLRALIERTRVKPEQVLLIGARTMDPEEDRYLIKSGIRLLFIGDVRKDVGRAVELVKAFVGDRDFYVSFDIDVFDSRIVSATGYPEVGGLMKNEVFSLLDGLLELKGYRGGDVVEYNPTKSNYEEVLILVREVLAKFTGITKDS